MINVLLLRYKYFFFPAELHGYASMSIEQCTSPTSMQCFSAMILFFVLDTQRTTECPYDFNVANVMTECRMYTRINRLFPCHALPLVVHDHMFGLRRPDIRGWFALRDKRRFSPDVLRTVRARANRRGDV